MGKKTKRSDIVSKWTKGSVLTGDTTYGNEYQLVQQARRSGTPITNKMARNINRYIAQEFRDTPIRAPTIPRQFHSQRYLYRGFSGPLWKKFKNHGSLVDKGYMAFSRKHWVARSHAVKDFLNILELRKTFGLPENQDTYGVVRLSLAQVPRGTPWIWFDSLNGRNDNNNIPYNNSTVKFFNQYGLPYTHRYKTPENIANSVWNILEYTSPGFYERPHHRSRRGGNQVRYARENKDSNSEQEVLLPPGTLTWVGETNTRHGKVVDVTYTPDWKASTCKRNNGRPTQPIHRVNRVTKRSTKRNLENPNLQRFSSKTRKL